MDAIHRQRLPLVHWARPRISLAEADDIGLAVAAHQPHEMHAAEKPIALHIFLLDKVRQGLILRIESAPPQQPQHAIAGDEFLATSDAFGGLLAAFVLFCAAQTLPEELERVHPSILLGLCEALSCLNGLQELHEVLKVQLRGLLLTTCLDQEPLDDILQRGEAQTFHHALELFPVDVATPIHVCTFETRPQRLPLQLADLACPDQELPAADRPRAVRPLPCLLVGAIHTGDGVRDLAADELPDVTECGRAKEP
mmetsp:Transcript_33647/g.85003  ORF Transcript_33647/g.85003 Transcript_33647/m.85003 type:complete len:254 (-) Transcript_33647:1176-1937(-)